MKKFILFLFMLCELIFAQKQGLPQKFSVVTFGIDKYENNWQDDWYGGVRGAERLVSSMENNINKLYPSINFSKKFYNNENARHSEFISNNTEKYNFLYYHGHGGPNRICMWDKNKRVWNDDKKFGTTGTYWVMMVSCNVFRNDYSDQDPWFDGVHSILGFASIVWGGENTRSCGFLNLKTCHHYSSDMEEEFAERWIKGKETIWSAFKNAVYYQLYDFGSKYKRAWYQKGVIPKIVYRYGYINGKFFDPWEEKFENAYQGPVFRTNYSGIGSRWNVMGEPVYAEP